MQLCSVCVTHPCPFEHLIVSLPNSDKPYIPRYCTMVCLWVFWSPLLISHQNKVKFLGNKNVSAACQTYKNVFRTDNRLQPFRSNYFKSVSQCWLTFPVSLPSPFPMDTCPNKKTTPPGGPSTVLCHCRVCHVTLGKKTGQELHGPRAASHHQARQPLTPGSSCIGCADMADRLLFIPPPLNWISDSIQRNFPVR